MISYIYAYDIRDYNKTKQLLNYLPDTIFKRISVPEQLYGISNTNIYVSKLAFLRKDYNEIIEFLRTRNLTHYYVLH